MHHSPLTYKGSKILKEIVLKEPNSYVLLLQPSNHIQHNLIKIKNKKVVWKASAGNSSEDNLFFDMRLEKEGCINAITMGGDSARINNLTGECIKRKENIPRSFNIPTEEISIN